MGIRLASELDRQLCWLMFGMPHATTVYRVDDSEWWTWSCSRGCRVPARPKRSHGLSPGELFRIVGAHGLGGQHLTGWWAEDWAAARSARASAKGGWVGGNEWGEVKADGLHIWYGSRYTGKPPKLTERNFEARIRPADVVVTWREVHEIVVRGATPERQAAYAAAVKCYVEQMGRSVPSRRDLRRPGWDYFTDPENVAHWEANSAAIGRLHEASDAIVRAGCVGPPGSKELADWEARDHQEKARQNTPLTSVRGANGKGVDGMALHWDLTKCDNLREQYPPTEDGQMNAVTYAIIWATILVGIGEITDKTAGEFYARVHIWEVTRGAFVQMRDDETTDYVERPITPEDVRAHRGLSTNVFPMETRAKWVKRILSGRMDEFATEYRAATEDVPREVTG